MVETILYQQHFVVKKYEVQSWSAAPQGPVVERIADAACKRIIDVGPARVHGHISFEGYLPVRFQRYPFSKLQRSVYEFETKKRAKQQHVGTIGDVVFVARQIHLSETQSTVVVVGLLLPDEGVLAVGHKGCAPPAFGRQIALVPDGKCQRVAVGKDAEAVFEQAGPEVVAIERVCADVAEIAGEFVFERKITLQVPAVEEEAWIEAVGYNGGYSVLVKTQFCIVKSACAGAVVESQLGAEPLRNKAVFEPEKELFIAFGGIVDLSVLGILNVGINAQRLFPVNERQGVSEVVFSGVTKLYFCFQRVVVAAEIGVAEVQSVVDPLQRSFLFYPPHIEISVGQIKYRHRINVPRFIHLHAYMHPVVAGLPVFIVNVHFGKQGCVDQHQAAFFQQAGQLIQWQRITCAHLHFAQYDGVFGALVACNADFADVAQAVGLGGGAPAKNPDEGRYGQNSLHLKTK